MAMMMPSIASAQSISEQDVESDSGWCGRLPFCVSSTGSHAAVLVWPDIWRYGPLSGKWAADWRGRLRSADGEPFLP